MNLIIVQLSHNKGIQTVNCLFHWHAIVPAYLLLTEHLRLLRFPEPMYDVDALLAAQVYSAHELCFYTGFQVDE